MCEHMTPEERALALLAKRADRLRLSGTARAEFISAMKNTGWFFDLVRQETDDSTGSRDV